MALTDNLVSYWTLDETSGTRADSHGSNDLADNNTVGYAAGKLNNAADFERDNSEYLSAADHSSLDLTGDISVSLWVKLETQVPSWLRYDLVGKWINTDTFGDHSWVLSYYHDSGYFLSFGVAALDYQNPQWHPVSQTLSTGTWYHIVATWDASEHTATFYVDGSSIGSNNSGTYTSQASTAAPLRIGAASGGGSAVDGLIDEVGLWSRVLSSSEVTSLYNSGTPLAYPFSTGVTVPVFMNQYRQRRAS